MSQLVTKCNIMLCQVTNLLFMDSENFKEQFIEDVKGRLYEQGVEANLSVHMVTNSTKTMKQSQLLL